MQPAELTNVPRVDLVAALEPDALALWLSNEYEPHTEAVATLLAAYERFLVATKDGITDEPIAGRATDFARQLKLESSATDATRARIKAPVLNAQRLIDGGAKALVDQLKAATSVVEQRIGVYLSEKARKEREAAEAEARRAALEADMAMEVADNVHTPQAADDAVRLLHEAQLAQKMAEAPLPELSRTRSVGGGLSGLKENWTYAVEDLSKVPMHLLQINDAATKLAIKQGAREIPGLRVFNDPKVYVR